MANDPPTYRAFLCYAPRDKRAAKRWHKRLEALKIDRDHVGRPTPLGPVPASLKPILRDRRDVPAGGELDARTRDALARSAALLVLASLSAARSYAVNEKIRHFRHHYPDRPVVVILHGPKRTAFRDHLPPALGHALDENGNVTDHEETPFAADPRADGDRSATAKVLRGLIGLGDADTARWVRQALRREGFRSFALALGEIAATALLIYMLPGLIYVGRAEFLAAKGQAAQSARHYQVAADDFQTASNVVHFNPEAARDFTAASAYALFLQGYEFGDNAALTTAIARYRAALALVPRETDPARWSVIETGLAWALFRLGERESSPDHLEEAVAAYRAIASERTRQSAPQDWAAAQTGVGNALSDLGERESGTARQEEAVNAYRAALLEYTRERVPLDWAATQNDLGNALQALGERETGTARLEEAVAAYHAALLERPRERVPLDWAYTQTNLGNTLTILAQRRHDRAQMTEAIAAMRKAVEVYREGNDSYRLPIAERRIAKMEAELQKMP